MAHADASEDVAAGASKDAPKPLDDQTPAQSAAQVKRDAPEEVVVIVEDDDASASPPPAPSPPKICAPSVELMFANGESAIDRDELLRTFKPTAEKFSEHKIVVEGYASAEGSARTNLQLSHLRATRVKSQLADLGIDASRLSVQAFGEYRPNLDGDADRDRRVVVKIEGVATCPKKAAGE